MAVRLLASIGETYLIPFPERKFNKLQVYYSTTVRRRRVAASTSNLIATPSLGLSSTSSPAISNLKAHSVLLHWLATVIQFGPRHFNWTVVITLVAYKMLPRSSSSLQQVLHTHCTPRITMPWYAAAAGVEGSVGGGGNRSTWNWQKNKGIKGFPTVSDSSMQFSIRSLALYTLQ